MKKILLLLVLALSLTFASQALAETYGPDFARFTVTPPAGWTATAMDGGVQLTNGKSALVITVVKDPGMGLEDFAKAVAQQAGIENSKVESANGMVKVTGKKSGADLQVYLAKDEGKIAVFTLAGPEVEAMQKIIETVEDAK
ncbi:MAG: hypothetical protein IJU40_01425 [Desulfovibrionaceae bacterium]|nr:hypothetical protein [Desulfovibrionaceae bacterium]